MATTGFWPIKGSLLDVLKYANNPDKTTERKYLDDDLFKALRYVSNDQKTDEQMYVTGINCPTERAYEQMMMTKRRFGKLGGNVAYHGYQSFAEGEVTPEEAHQIGLQTAREMWGDEYEILVTTHLNVSHLHNHIVINSVSFKTGRKFENHIRDHRRLRDISDRICKERGKSVLENSDFYKNEKKVYWIRKSGQIHRKDMLRRDVDEALAHTISPVDFQVYLESLGYRFARNYVRHAHPSVIAPNWKQPIRIDSLGKDYSRQAIIERLESQHRDKHFMDFYTPRPYTRRKPLIKLILDYEKKHEPDFITSLYQLLFLIIKLVTGNNVQKQDYRPLLPELRAEIENADRSLEEYHFLDDHNVECAEDFLVCRKDIEKQISDYEAERQHLRNKIRRAKTPEEDFQLKEQCKEITKKLTPLRKQLKICERIEKKVPLLQTLIEQEKQLEQGRYKYKYYQQNQKKDRGYIR